MSNIEPIIGTFHDAVTNKTIVRELTANEIALLPEPTDEAAPATS